MEKNRWNGIVRVFKDCNDLSRNWGEGHYITGAPPLVKLQKKISDRFGEDWSTLVTSQGMTAISTVINFLTKSGDTIALSKDVYPGTFLWLDELEKKGCLKVRKFSPDKPAELQEILKDGDIRLVFTEGIGNSPTMPVADIPKIQKLCTKYLCVLVIDTTSTPFFVPAFDSKTILVGSLTKYECPNDDLMGGWISANPDLIRELGGTMEYRKSAMVPEVAEHYLRTIAGTARRYQGHCDNAKILAGICEKHPAVAQAWYPSMARGGMLHLKLKGGEKAAQFADRLTGDWEIGVSFGSDKWRVVPFIGELAKYVGTEGIVRIASGRVNPRKNIAVFKRALDSLV